jgi:dihydropyrimidinase
MAKAEGNCAIDYGFHMIIGDVNDETLKEMDTSSTRASPASSCSWPTRASSTPTTAQILRAMQKTGRERRADHDARRERHRHRRARRAGARPGETDPIYHGSQPLAGLEGEATHRAIQLAEVAGRAAVHRAPVGDARRSTRCAGPRRGLNVFAETCPQYLFLTSRTPGQRLRGRQVRVLAPAAHQARPPPGATCGRACAPTTWQVVSTDHCPFCMKDQKELGLGRVALPRARKRIDAAPRNTSATNIDEQARREGGGDDGCPRRRSPCEARAVAGWRPPAAVARPPTTAPAPMSTVIVA